MSNNFKSETIWIFSGYGHIAPSNENGQLLCILYTLIGLPIMFAFLGKIGGVMAKALKYSYSRLCCRWCRVRRKWEEDQDGLTISLKNEDVGEESYMPTDEVMSPYRN